jgi:hypothetical protein
MAMGPEFREDPASISAEERERRRKLVGDKLVRRLPVKTIRIPAAALFAALGVITLSGLKL